MNDRREVGGHALQGGSRAEGEGNACVASGKKRVKSALSVIGCRSRVDNPWLGMSSTRRRGGVA